MKGAAEATAAGNHPSVTTPWGSMQWSPVEYKDASGDTQQRWEGTVNLSPQQQAALNDQFAIQAGRSDLASQLLGRAGADVSQGFNWESLGAMPSGEAARQQAIDAAYNQAASRLDPQWSQREEATRSQLLNQGFNMGDQGYARALEDFGRQRNDAYTSAMNSAIGQGTQAGQVAFQQGLQGRQQAIGEGQQRQYSGLNALNALMSGQQVGMPNFPGMNMTGANYLGAAQAQAPYDAANMQALIGGGTSLLAAGIPFAFSDERLKERIERTEAEVLPGVPLATWEWKGLPGVRCSGVIAQDVLRVAPEFVCADPATGFLMVNYQALLGGAQ
jgi:hypothetical protein